MHDAERWQEIWATTCHAIWRWRNQRIFEDKHIMLHNMLEKLGSEFTDTEDHVRYLHQMAATK